MSELIVVDSISKAHQFLDLGKPKYPLASVFYPKDELRSDFGGVTIRLDIYQITFKNTSGGSFGYGRNSYDFTEGSLLFTKPGQTLTLGNYEDVESASGGWSLIFHPDLIRKSPLGKHIDEYSFFSYDVNEALHVSEEERSSLMEIIQKIETEYSQNIDRHSQKLIVSNIELLLDYCTRYYDRQFYTRTNLNQDIVSKFEVLLRDYYKTDKVHSSGIPTVKYCGAALNMSPNYLSDLLKKETGMGALEQIHRYVVERAKTQLLGTTDSISSIAYELGFEYPQHFSKLFKSKTGMSPAEYRTLN